MPALTMVAACRNALAGVGAAMAPGSQNWNGMIADLLIPPTIINTTAVVINGPDGGFAMISEMVKVPAVTPSITTPISSTKPPAVVTIRACEAAIRDDRLPVRCAISRYDRIPVSSQKITSRIRLSAQTRPSMAPANAISAPLYRPRPSSLSGKYRPEYSSTRVPTPATTNVMIIDRASSRRSIDNDSDGTHCMVVDLDPPSRTAGRWASAHTV